MRKLNRVIAAGALAVPMALGASGIAVAADGSSGSQNQVDATEGNGAGSEDDILNLDQGDEDSGNGDSGNGGNLLEEILEGLFGDNDEDRSGGNDSIFGGDDDGDFGGNDSLGIF